MQWLRAAQQAPQARAMCRWYAVTLAIAQVGWVLLAVVASQGWDLTSAAFVFASMGLTFGMWWIYFAVPFGEILHHRRE